MEWILGIAIGLALGGALGWWLTRRTLAPRIESARAAALAEAGTAQATLEERLAGRDREIESLKSEIAGLQSKLEAAHAEIADLRSARDTLKTSLEEQRKYAEEKLKLVEDAKQKLLDSFKSLSSDALQRNNESFLDLAKQTLGKYQEQARGDLDKRRDAIEGLVKPIRETLGKYEQRVGEIEKARQEAYGGLQQQVKQMAESQQQLQQETGKLVQALRTPQARGRWGEIQLERVVEMAGMMEYCDFNRQSSTETDTGRLRPDLVVKLPGGKSVVVDAKCPLEAYLNHIEATEAEVKDSHLANHARHIRSHIKQLSAKAYWDQFDQAPEFVVLFLPGENFFSAALQKAPDLIQEGVDQRVILATPTTLIALLKAVSYGWRQEALQKNAREIHDLGKELYDRLTVLSGHLTKLGSSLASAVKNYNSTVGSLESRVLPGARRFGELGVGVKEEMPQLTDVDQTPRDLHAPELTETVARKRLEASGEGSEDEDGQEKMQETPAQRED